jgi:pimeloyl-ACP methyl ester carboxylesterase
MTTVFLHPVGLDHEFWQFTGLEGSMPDYPGHGGRPLPPLDEYTLATVADEIVRDHEGPLDVVGVSMGSAVAQYIGVRHPDRVRSMMLCCSSLGGTVASAAEVLRDDRADDTLRLGMAGMMDSTLTRWFTEAALADPDHPGVAYARARLLADDPQAIAATWLTLRRSAVRDSLPALRMPVTVLGGRDDRAATPERVLALFGEIPTARLEIVNGPHMLPLEQPAAFAAAVRRHFDWVESSGLAP